MTLADKIHNAVAGKRWYAPLTLVSYWLFGILCFWASGAMILEGRFDYLWRATRLFAGGDRTITSQDQPVGFTLLALSFAGSGICFLLMGWMKFLKRRRSYLASAKCL